MEKIRTFIALEISDKVRDELSRIESMLKKVDANVKWVKPDSVHLTLKFLGYIDEEKVQVISKHLENIASGSHPFKMVLEKIGVFPHWNYPKVVWVGISEVAGEAKEIAAMVDEAMAGEGFEKEKRPFSPHLTIGRVRGPQNKLELQKAADSVEVQPTSSDITKIVLFKSDLTREGAVYTPLYTANLAG